MVNIKIDQINIPDDELFKQVHTKFKYNEFRQYQQEVIYTIIKAFKGGFDNVILEAPTGAGKSLIAHTIANFYNKTFLLTSQKTLQDQYEREFDDMHVLKGKSNYNCLTEPITMEDCRKGKSCAVMCDYKVAELNFIESKIGVTNYHTALMKRSIIPRDLLVCDEAHNIEHILMSIISISLKDKYLSKLQLTSSGKMNNLLEVSEYLRGLKFEVCSKLAATKADIETAQGSGLGVDVKLYRYEKRLDSLNEKIDTFFQTEEKCDWIYCQNEKMLKPLYVSYFAPKLFQLATKKLFMSATILHKGLFCANIGLKPDKTVFVRMPSTFPVNNRPIYTAFATHNLNRQNIDDNLPEVVRKTEYLLGKYKNQKGIIHTNSYKISEFIQYKIRDKRLLFVTSENKDTMLQHHFKSSEPTVLVSPGLKEGVDLKGKLSEWQVIVKLPYPFLGDQQIKARMDRQRLWYDWKTCLDLVQSYGRSIRSETDCANTYVFDRTFAWFCNKNKAILPDWFISAIRKGE